MASPSSLPVLHVVTDDRVLADPGFTQRARRVLATGGPDLALHLRGPGTDGRRLHDLASALFPAAEESGALLLVNDRVDVAACAGVHGVQLGQRSLPPGVARSLLGARARVGVSVHSPAEAEAAAGADFLLVGTLFATASHPGRAGAGPGLLAAVGDVAPDLPRIGIGGVTPGRLAELRRVGAHGVAVLGGVWRTRAPAEATGRYLTEWHDAG